MKKLSLFLILIVFFLGCKKEDALPLPSAVISTTESDYGTVTFGVSAQNTTSYQWDFGDNSPVESGITPKHTYARNGNFTVNLKLTGPGGTATAIKTLIVSNVRGTGTFWMRSGGYNVAVTIDGIYADVITSNYTGTSLACNATGCANFVFLREGAHSFTAKEQGRTFPKTWSGTITISGGGCARQELLN